MSSFAQRDFKDYCKDVWGMPNGELPSGASPDITLDEVEKAYLYAWNQGFNLGQDTVYIKETVQ